uniref:Uncharacterized protein n=1 Tax=Lactuca sativa TaxID=4236 RepID=A0A9R1WH95_LACSA|nr:hypothetical protein LSAT_V11C200063510 [Lactuca sativa]
MLFEWNGAIILTSWLSALLLTPSICLLNACLMIRLEYCLLPLLPIGAFLLGTGTASGGRGGGWTAGGGGGGGWTAGGGGGGGGGGGCWAAGGGGGGGWAAGGGGGGGWAAGGGRGGCWAAGGGGGGRWTVGGGHSLCDNPNLFPSILARFRQ